LEAEVTAPNRIVRALLIGIDEYDHYPTHHLRRAVVEAQEWGRAVQRARTTIPFQVHVNIGRAAMRSALLSFVADLSGEIRTGSDYGLLVFAGNGAGVYTGTSSRSYLCPSDFDLADPGATGISLDELCEILEPLNCGRPSLLAAFNCAVSDPAGLPGNHYRPRTVTPNLQVEFGPYEGGWAIAEGAELGKYACPANNGGYDFVVRDFQVGPVLPLSGKVSEADDIVVLPSGPAAEILYSLKMEISAGTNGFWLILDGNGIEIGQLLTTALIPSSVPAPWEPSRAYWFWKPAVQKFPAEFVLQRVSPMPNLQNLGAPTDIHRELSFPAGTVNWFPSPGPSQGWQITRNGFSGAMMGRLYHFGDAPAITQQHELAPDGPNLTTAGWFALGSEDLLFYKALAPLSLPGTSMRHVQTYP
jgi:hypothetical protein